MNRAWQMGLMALATLIIVPIVWLTCFPPELTRVGANYTAKIVCTNVFMTGRDANDVLREDVQSPGLPILEWMKVDVDHAAGIVRAGLLGFIGDGLAVYRPGTGCAAVPDGNIALAREHQFTPPPIPAPPDQLDWPTGSAASVNPAIESIIDDPQLSGPGMRALLVIHRGKLIAERYGQGFDRHSPLVGWSMTKSVNAILVGIQILNGKLRLDQSGFWPNLPPDDPHQQIKLRDLLSMTSGLAFDEDYGVVSDVTRMLYLAPDMDAFVQSKPMAHPAGTVWSYSTGTAVLLSHLWQERAGSAIEALRFPSQYLFAPLGMSSAFIEADEAGNMVGGSYMYANAQDWARIGQLLLQDGVWNGNRLLPEGYVDMMHRPVPGSDDIYGMGQLWREGPGDNHPDRAFPLPKDAFWLQGHDGQAMVVVPSSQLVMVRLGLTPKRLQYRPQAMLAKIIKALH